MTKSKYIFAALTLTLLILGGAWLINQQQSNNKEETSASPTTEILGSNQLTKVSQITATEDINSLTLTSDEKTLYVPSFDEDLVYAIDTADSAVSRTLEIKSPWAAAVSKDNRRLYITQGNNRVSLVDPGSGRILKSARTGDQPSFLFLTPDEKYLLVVNFLSNNINIFKAPALELVSSIPVGKRPRSLAYNPLAKIAYVANFDESSISVISLDSFTEIGRVRFYGRPNQLFYHPQLQKLFVTDSFNNQVLVIDPIGLKVDKRIAVDKFPFGFSLGRRNSELLVAGYDQNSIGIIDLKNLALTKTLQTEKGFVGSSGFNLLTYVKSQNKLFISNTLHGQILVYDFK